MVSDRGSHDPEWLEFHPSGVPEDPRSRRRRRLVVAAGVVVVLLVGGNAVRSADPEASAPPPTPPAASATTPAPSATTPAPRRTPLAGPTVLPGSRPLLADADLELFVRGNAAVFRIEVGTGRIIRTETPPMRLTGDYSFVAGPHDVVLAPADDGPGVLVPDGQRARTLPGLLADPGQIFPAADGQLWFQSSVGGQLGEERLPPVRLTSFDGRAGRTSIPVGGGFVTDDGRGNLLLKGAGGVFEIDGTTARRVTTGGVSAVGPHHYLTLECDAAHQCSTYLYDRTTRRQRRIGSAEAGGIASGIISADGTHAVLIHWDRAGPPQFVVLDLRDGTETPIPGSPDRELSEVRGNVVWSPDSRWLFALVEGHLTIVDVKTRVVVTPDLPLPPLRQIALRPPTTGDE